MESLPKEVENEFKQGNFVVKGGSLKFNQVDPDHAQEWLNGTCKKSGGIIGITKNFSALAKWTLTFSLRSKLLGASAGPNPKLTGQRDLVFIK